MKKKEWIILAVIAVLAAGFLLWTNRDQKVPADTGTVPTEEAVPTEETVPTVSPEDAQYMVSVVYHNRVIMTFDYREDAVYHVDGDSGGLEIEVKDNKWHVINEQCPNHICASMGWVDVNEIIPITCLPNGIFIYPGVEG